MMIWLALLSCILALVPMLLFLRNLRLYRLLPRAHSLGRKWSVLIPARNEEANIGAALRSVLDSDGVEIEVIVLDDHSTDRTAGIVRAIAQTDPRVRLETAPALPAGWFGKNFACHRLAGLARHPILLFLDADVRVSRPDSLARLAAFVEQSGTALFSGVPREETYGLMEQLIIPLIHFVLLGFLSLDRMRAGTDPRFAAACGQILAVDRDAYKRAGGHAAIADRMHDAVALARVFRARGLTTDLFDATDTFRCRMYRSATEVWHGFAKNAHEGLGSPQLILPATLLLLGGQILPLFVLAVAKSPLVLTLAVVAALAAYLPRIVGAARFRQSLLGAVLHPVGVCALVAIQWFAFFRSLRHQPAVWRGRSYSSPLAA